MTATGTPPPRMAKVFDGASGGVPHFDAEHPILDTSERALVGTYLGAGAVLVSTTTRAPDFADDARRPVVPMGYRTDGRWIWNDALAYYVAIHGYAPEREFLEHMNVLRFQCPTPTGEEVAAALRQLAD